MARVFVAMSGGVDSSVAAALLLEQGHDVTGVTMQLWPSGEIEGGCCSVSAVRDARRVCDTLGVAHYALNFRDVFEREVVAPFAAQYAAGRTPNPCIACNDRVKFSDLLAKVSLQGAEYLATGHYARVVRDANGVPWLSRGLDDGKDQSYFLYRMTHGQLDHTLFPVGELHKTDVRTLARSLGLSVAEKAESQETCFAVEGDYMPAVGARAPDALEPGPIVDRAGTVLGHHDGIAHFTVGQRRGIGVGGLETPLYVIAIYADSRTVVVGPREQLAVSRVAASEVVWRGCASMPVHAAVRYRMPAVPAEATMADDGRLLVDLESALYGVAPGQSVVCYEGDTVLGGGVIECAS